MALATRCPSCNTIFRISTAQAAAKGGMVRCGQCHNVFNSLDALVRVEDLEVIDEVSVDPVVVESIRSSNPEPPVDRHDEAEADNKADADADAFVEQAVERATVSPWWLPEHGDAPSAPPALREEPDVAESPSLRDDAGRLLTGRRTDLPRSAIALDGTNPTFMRPDADVVPTRRGARWAFGALTLLAALVLAAQGAYVWRDELAVRWSPSRPWLVAACVPLRCRVDYPAHVDAITIESANVQASGANLNVYVMTALLRNRDSVDLRYPHLELVLTDLQDRPILRRVLRPEDYLQPSRDSGRTDTPGFPAESELPVRVMFELNDLRFAGYRVDRFYP